MEAADRRRVLVRSKDAERRVCRLFGGERGPVGYAVSDCVNTPFSIEVKRSKGGSPRVAWIEQARSQGHREGKPWLLAIVGHNDRRPTGTMDLEQLAGMVEALRQIATAGGPTEPTLALCKALARSALRAGTLIADEISLRAETSSFAGQPLLLDDGSLSGSVRPSS